MDGTLLWLSRLFSRTPAFVIRYRWPILLLITLTSLLLAWTSATRTSLDMTLDNFIDQRDPAIRALNEFRSQFGGDDSVFLVYRAADDDIFSARSLQATQELTRRLRNWHEVTADELPERINGNRVDVTALSRIRRVQSLTTLRIQQSEGDMLRSVRLVPEQIPTDPQELQQIRERALAQDDLRLAWFSDDGRYGAILIQTTFGADPVDGFVAAVDQAEVSLGDSFSAFDDPDSFDLAFD